MNVSPYLERIERYSNHVTADAKCIATSVDVIALAPDFETRAEDAMRKAETELTAALETVRGALKEYTAKPITA